MASLHQTSTEYIRKHGGQSTLCPPSWQALLCHLYINICSMMERTSPQTRLRALLWTWTGSYPFFFGLPQHMAHSELQVMANLCVVAVGQAASIRTYSLGTSLRWSLRSIGPKVEELGFQPWLAGLQSVLLIAAAWITWGLPWSWLRIEWPFQTMCLEVWQHQEEITHYNLNSNERQRW